MRVKRPLSAVVAATFTVMLVGALMTLAPGAQAGGPRVLILGPTVDGGAASIEATHAASLGFAVDIVDATDWAAMSGADFGAYEGIILGDPHCRSRSTFQAAIDNAPVWSSQIDGNRILIGTDPVYHAEQGGQAVTERGLDFALDGSGDTGLYLTLSCFGGSEPGTEPLLAGLGDFVTVGAGCNDEARIVASHPALEGLTDDDLGPWGCSVHDAFVEWPEDEWVVLALQVDPDEGVVTTPGGLRGNPYILASGEGLEADRALNLEPDSQTHEVGGDCDFEVTVQIDGEPIADAEILFSVTSGPHEGEEGTATTNGSGVATFAYEGTEVGTDTIIATFDRDGTILESNEVTCTLTAPPTTTTTTTTTAPPPPPAPPAPPIPAIPTFTG